MSDVIKPSRLLHTLALDALPQDGVLHRFDYTDEFANASKGLVLRWNGDIYAYQDRCPHLSIPLGETEDILDKRTGFLVCAMHGARFEPQTGLCVLGPCMGDRLKKLEVRVEGLSVHILRGSALSL